MNYDKTLLWNHLSQFTPDVPGAALTFTHRLARENGWSLTFAEQVFNEYRKFLFLCAISPQPVTPSDAVDQAWHLHLSYTESYWNDLCRNILGKELHHHPTQGGESEQNKYSGYYNCTLELYRSTFYSDPPVAIWPPEQERFSDIDFVRVNKRTNWVFKKFRISIPPSILFIAGGAIITWAVNTPAVLPAYVVLSLIGYSIFADATGKGRRTTWSSDSGCGGGCSMGDGDSGCSSGCSGCGGGCGGGGD